MSLLERAAAIFPPPNYMRMPSVGIDISDTSLKYIFFKPSAHADRNFDLVHYGDIEIEAGAVERGVVNDVGKLAKAMAAVKAATKIDHVRISLPEERAYIFETEIPRGTPFKKLEDN